MSQLNPFTSAISQSLAAQRLLSVEKERQVHREQIQEKNVAAEDRFEHQVESAERVEAVGDEAPEQREQPQDRRTPRQSKGQGKADEKPSIDLKA